MKRYFDLMERVARAAIDAGLTTPLIRRQHAQALIDQGYLSAAIGALEALVLDTASGRPDAYPPEHVETIGLLGRAHKQA